MKKLRLWGMTIIMVLVADCFYACSSAEEEGGENNAPQNEKYFDVSLAMEGINVSEELLTRVGTDNLKTVYKIIVYYDYKSNGDVTYKYAEGTFDNISAMQLSMLAGHKYRFVCSIWKEVTGGVSLKHFSGFGYGSSDITNKFEIVQSSSSTSSTYFIPGNCQSTCITTSNSITTYTYRRDYTRYYGELSDYTPTQNGTAIIKMVEASRCGLHVTIAPPSEGNLSVSTDKSYHFYESNYDYSTQYVYQTLTNKSQKYDDGGIQFIVGENVMNHWSDVFFGKTINQNLFDVVFTIRWTNYNEAGVQIGNSTTQKTITLKRDVMTNVNIDLNINNADTNNAKIGFTYDSNGDMSNSGENWTVNVNNDGTMDVTVIPQ